MNGWVQFGDPLTLCVGVRESAHAGIEIGRFRFSVQGIEIADRRLTQWLKLPGTHVYSLLTREGTAPSICWQFADAASIMEEVQRATLLSHYEWTPLLGPDTPAYKFAAGRHSLDWHVVDCFRARELVAFTDDEHICLLMARRRFDGTDWRYDRHREFVIEKSSARDVAARFWDWFVPRWRERTGETLEIRRDWMGRWL